MTGHAEFSPSSAHRWMVCPGSIRLSRGIPRSDNRYSREGTFGHAIAAECLTTGADAVTHVGRTDGEFILDAELADHIQVYLDYVRGLVTMEGGELLVEQQVKVNDDIYGTADAIVVCEDTVHIVDLKLGAGQFVDAKGNEQLEVYGLASLKAAKKDAKYVGTHIVQPRCAADWPWRSARLAAEELLKWEHNLMEAVTAAKTEDAPLVPGDHCQWCPARDLCPERRSRALATAKSVFRDLTLTAPAVTPPSPVHLTPQQVVTVLEGQDILEAWMKGVIEMAHDLAKRGELPGYKLVEKRGLRKWNDETIAEAALRQVGVNPLAPAKVISPAQAEKALTKVIGGKRAETAIEGLAHKPVTGETLVPVSDPRPALNSASVFSPVSN